MSDLTKTMSLGELFNDKGKGRHRKSRPFLRWRLTPRSAVAIVAIFALLGGVTLVGWALYQPYANQDAIQDTQNNLEKQWEQGDSSVVSLPGETSNPKPTKTSGPGFTPIAKLIIPSLNFSKFVIEGVSVSDLRYAPGHYPGSAMPGKAGNFAVAGHRDRGMFWDLDQVKPGQQVIVETKTKRFTYTVVSRIITKPNATQEVAAVPPGFSRGDKILTLTTCNPKWDNYERLIVHAKLTSTQNL